MRKYAKSVTYCITDSLPDNAPVSALFSDMPCGGDTLMGRQDGRASNEFRNIRSYFQYFQILKKIYTHYCLK